MRNNFASGIADWFSVLAVCWGSKNIVEMVRTIHQRWRGVYRYAIYLVLAMTIFKRLHF